MIIKHGKISNLTGNVIIYWDIVNEEKNESLNYKIIAFNFMISPLSIHNKFITSFFPPILFKSFSSILKKIKNLNCDIIYAGKIKFLNKKRYLTYFNRNQFNQFNKIVKIYVKLYKQKFKFSLKDLTEEQKILLIQKLSQKLRSQSSNTKSKRNLIVKQIQDIILSLDEAAKYDFSYFVSLLLEEGKVIDELIILYGKKFLSIFYEKYENVLILNDQIQEKISFLRKLP